MNIKNYARFVANYSDEEVREQYNNYCELTKMAWDNAEYSSGEEREDWLDEYDEDKKHLDVLSRELTRRNL